MSVERGRKMRVWEHTGPKLRIRGVRDQGAVVKGLWSRGYGQGTVVKGLWSMAMAKGYGQGRSSSRPVRDTSFV